MVKYQHKIRFFKKVVILSGVPSIRDAAEGSN